MSNIVLEQPKHLVDIRSGMPWSDWPVPILHNLPLSDLAVSFTEAPEGTDAETGQRLILNRSQLAERADGTKFLEEEMLGRANDVCLRELSTRVSFPLEFVKKLPLQLQVDVINQRIMDAREQDFGLTVEEVEGTFEVTNIMPGWRGVVPHADVCETVYSRLEQQFGQVELDRLRTGVGGLEAYFLTPHQAPVSPKVGDVLQLGIKVHHNYGQELETALYVRRLACLNGMARTSSEFSWSQRTVGSADHQLNFLREGVERALDSYDDLLEHARLMSTTEFHGDPSQVIRERARAMGIPQRYHAELVDAFQQEPGQTEWDMLNAFTRLATHGALPRRLSRAMQLAAGEWVGDFDIVSARLPRPLAVKIGAEISEADLN